MDKQETMTTREVCELLGLRDVGTVRGYVRRGWLPATRLISGGLCFERADVETFRKHALAKPPHNRANDKYWATYKHGKEKSA